MTQSAPDLSVKYYEDVNAEVVNTCPMFTEEIQEKNTQEFKELVQDDLFLF